MVPVTRIPAGYSRALTFVRLPYDTGKATLLHRRVAMTAITDVAPDLTTRRRLGRTFLAAAGVWVAYIALAVTFSADYEKALEDASESLDQPVNRLPAETLAQITQD